MVLKVDTPFTLVCGLFKGAVFLILSVLYFSFALNLYKVTGQFPWSSLKETDRGLSAELNVRRFLGF